MKVFFGKEGVTLYPQASSVICKDIRRIWSKCIFWGGRANNPILCKNFLGPSQPDVDFCTGFSGDVH